MTNENPEVERGDRWVDVSPSQLAAIRKDVIEACARALELDATYNDRVMRDEKDDLAVRYRAQQSARVKRQCADILRAMQSKL